MREQDPPPFAPGDVMDGKYRVEGVLGTGGMGCVLSVTHLALGELRAVKLMRARALAHPVCVRRFAREARAAAKLRGQHVVRIHDVAKLPTGEPYIVMERLEGRDLAAHARARGPLDPHEAVSLVLQACEGLAEAHAAGIVHRDVKPENLFLALEQDGSACVKVLDFGISKLEEPLMMDGGATGGPLTESGAFFGSPAYMAPEQVRNAADVDARADVWALGVILYELLTGAPPFRGGSAHATLALVLESAPKSPSNLRPGLHAGLDRVILRCLEKDRASRYRGMPELAADLQALIGAGETGRDAAARRVPTSVVPTVAGAYEAPSGFRNRRHGAAIAGGFALGIAASALLTMRLGACSEPPVAETRDAPVGAHATADAATADAATADARDTGGADAATADASARSPDGARSAKPKEPDAGRRGMDASDGRDFDAGAELVVHDGGTQLPAGVGPVDAGFIFPEPWTSAPASSETK